MQTRADTKYTMTGLQRQKSALIEQLIFLTRACLCAIQPDVGVPQDSIKGNK